MEPELSKINMIETKLFYYYTKPYNKEKILYLRSMNGSKPLNK